MGGSPLVPFDAGQQSLTRADYVAVQRHWRMPANLSSLGGRFVDWIEASLSRAEFDRVPWLAVAFAAGIGSWFLLKTASAWITLIALLLLVAMLAALLWRGHEGRARTRLGLLSLAVVFCAGIATVWVRSEVVGADPIERPTVETLNGFVLERIDQPARDRFRLVLATRFGADLEARKVRVNVPLTNDQKGLREGAVVRLRARLMPPGPPVLPGGYDFARAAWFDGLAATGSLIGEISIIEAPKAAGTGSQWQRQLSAHVRSQMEGNGGSIAAAFASGDRGAIAETDRDAMRDAGLTHLLAISGLHVGAVIAAAYLITLKSLALFPFLALRMRLPIVAAAVGACAGIGYTVLTGMQVPTVRSCVAAMLVLLALALGREPLSLRMVAFAAMFVMALWPEAVIGPSFQMSFAAVLAIVSLHSAAPIKAFLAAREESWFARLVRRVVMLFTTGLVIELALMPIVLYHFHRAGLYGAAANVLAIPLVTLVSMPLIALGLLFDLAGLGMPFWWLAERSLDALLGLAHWVSSQPGAVKLFPHMGLTSILLFVGGGLWLALWSSRMRLLGLLPVCVASLSLAWTSHPDILITRDGRQVGITTDDGRLISLRAPRSSFAQDSLIELAGVAATPIAMTDWPEANCSDEFCVLRIVRDGRPWSALLTRNRVRVEERALAAACERVDIVVADRVLPRSCRPLWLKADKRMLDHAGGMSIYLAEPRIVSVADTQGEHGWWKPFQGLQTRRQMQSAAPNQ